MKKLFILAIIAISFVFPAFGKNLSLSAGKLSFEISDDATGAAFVLDGVAPAKESDFWRLILDDGQKTEIPVFSSKQKGKAVLSGNTLTINYSSLISDYGDTYPVSFSLVITCEGNLLKFTPTISNNAKGLRVNECFCPLADFESLGGNKKEDALYWPSGLGSRYENPWEYLESLAPAYYNHDEKETFIHLHYPNSSMGWYGVQSGSHFLYVARLDPKFRHCFLTVHHRIDGNDLMFGVDHFPMALSGETVSVPSTVIGLLNGDWREGAKLYRAWAEKNFFTPKPKAEWVKNLTGWQRVIMRSQYGEDYYKPSDLPELYNVGKKYGLKTIFLFAWWKEGMDRAYPKYEEQYPGEFKDLADNIRKVQEMGGRVILECNCHFIDPSSDFYKNNGDLVKILDINGEEYRKAFVYYGRGELRETYGQHQFVLACFGTDIWRNQVLGQIKLLNSFGPDCLFVDCIGGCPYQPCFNNTHEHGNRVDEEWVGQRKFFTDAEKYCNDNGKVLATEVLTDIAASFNQFVHGNANVDFSINSKAFPAMFRYTFPEVITTERNIYSSQGDYKRQFKNAITAGVRLDAQLWVCRADIGKDPDYAEMIGWYTSTMDKYGEYYYDGKYTVIDNSPLPNYIKRGEYLNADGSKVLKVLYNANTDKISFEEFDARNYCK